MTEANDKNTNGSSRKQDSVSQVDVNRLTRRLDHSVPEPMLLEEPKKSS